MLHTITVSVSQWKVCSKCKLFTLSTLIQITVLVEITLWPIEVIALRNKQMYVYCSDVH